MSKLSRRLVVYFVVVGLCCRSTDSHSPQGDKQHDDAPTGDDRFHRPSPLDLHKPPPPPSLMSSKGNDNSQHDDEDDESDEREPPPSTPDKRLFGPRKIARWFSRYARAPNRPFSRNYSPFAKRQDDAWIRERKRLWVSPFVPRFNIPKITRRQRRSLRDEDDIDDDEDEKWRELMIMEDDYEDGLDNDGPRRDEEVEREKQPIASLLRLESWLREADESERQEEAEENERRRRRPRHGEDSASGQRVDEEDDDDEEFENWLGLENHHPPPSVPPPMKLFANRPFGRRSRRNGDPCIKNGKLLRTLVCKYSG